MSCPKYVILLGPPGAGKGTQALALQDRFDLKHIASGDLFREHISKETELGRLAKTFIDKGELVPDDVTARMVMERIARPDCERGVVFDGFPRTDAQARALAAEFDKEGRRIAGVVLIRVPDEPLIQRLSSRWICPIDGAVYNLLSNPPKAPGRCDNDGGPLEQRNDDKPETVRHRLGVYHRQTQPLIDYYRLSGLLHEVNGERDIETVQADIAATVEKL